MLTCYFRHLCEVFERAGIEVTGENKREIDKVIHKIVGIEYKNCPAVWRKVKKRIARDRNAFIKELNEAWKRL